MNVSNEKDKDTKKVLLKNPNQTSRISEILFIFTCSSKFTSKVLYTVSSLPRNNKRIHIFLSIYSFLPVFHINRPQEGERGETHTCTNKVPEYSAIL